MHVVEVYRDAGAFGIVGSGSCLGVNSGPYLVLTKSCTANGAQTMVLVVAHVDRARCDDGTEWARR